MPSASSTKSLEMMPSCLAICGRHLEEKKEKKAFICHIYMRTHGIGPVHEPTQAKSQTTKPQMPRRMTMWAETLDLWWISKNTTTRFPFHALVGSVIPHLLINDQQCVNYML